MPLTLKLEMSTTTLKAITSNLSMFEEVSGMLRLTEKIVNRFQKTESPFYSHFTDLNTNTSLSESFPCVHPEEFLECSLLGWGHRIVAYPICQLLEFLPIFMSLSVTYNKRAESTGATLALLACSHSHT